MKNKKIISVLMVFSSSELGGAERSLTRMALTSSSIDYRLATLDGEGPWCDWVRTQGSQPIVFGITKWNFTWHIKIRSIFILTSLCAS